MTKIGRRFTPPHPRFQCDPIAIHDEFAISMMMDCFWRILCWDNPSLEYFKNEDIVFVHEARAGLFRTQRDTQVIG